MTFRNRTEAGRALARKLLAYARRPDVVVLGLPRGGVLVAEPIARALGAPLDVFVVRKLGVPEHPELAMGAIASGGVRVLNENIIADFAIAADVLAAVTADEQRELERRERVFRSASNAGPAPLQGKTVVVVDDGLATGASMRAAVAALRARGVAAVVVAVPIAAPEICAALGRQVDDIVCAMTPPALQGVGEHYQNFNQCSDQEVKAALARGALGTTPGPAPRPAPASLAEVVRTRARRLTGNSRDHDSLLALVGDGRLVLLGEASHGTHEFYEQRATITRRLIEEKGFRAVLAEADWPDAYRVNRFVRGQSNDRTAEAALGGFVRFPAWMWRNADVAEFVTWLRTHNDLLGRDKSRKVGFYGLDLYSLYTSMAAVVSYLEKVDPKAAARARDRYACFEQTGDDARRYGAAATAGFASCEQAVVEQLLEMQKHAVEFAGGTPLEEDERFFAVQNARVALSAEKYYRSMFHGQVASWNLRDRHMMQTLESVARHLSGDDGAPAKLIVWAHNSHLGDARATDMADVGELNLGQLVREHYGRQAMLVGFTTYSGTVTAASNWDEPAERKRVRPALPGSHEAVFHATGPPRFFLPLRDTRAPRDQKRLERAIGVIYRPETERQSHYLHAHLHDQFDAVIHIDETSALTPLGPPLSWQSGEAPETYPSAV